MLELEKSFSKPWKTLESCSDGLKILKMLRSQHRPKESGSIPGDSYAHKKFYNRCYKQTLSTKCRNSAPRRLRAYPVNQSTTCFLTVCSAHDANGGSQSITQTLEHLCKRTSAEWQLGSSSLEGTGHTTKWQMREEIWATWDLSQKEPWESEVYYYSNDYSVQPLQTSPRCLSW